MRYSKADHVDILVPENDTERHPTPFECAVLRATLESVRPTLGDEWANTAIGQASHLHVTRREFTQHGMYADLYVDSNMPPLALNECGPFGESLICIPGIEENRGVAGSMVFVSKQGFLNLLEIWTSGDRGWPYAEMREVVFSPTVECKIRY